MRDHVRKFSCQPGVTGRQRAKIFGRKPFSEWFDLCKRGIKYTKKKNSRVDVIDKDMDDNARDILLQIKNGTNISKVQEAGKVNFSRGGSSKRSLAFCPECREAQERSRPNLCWRRKLNHTLSRLVLSRKQER